MSDRATAFPEGAPANHDECRDFLRDHFASQGEQVRVSRYQPLLMSPSAYGGDGFRCTHGARYFAIVQSGGDQR